MRPNINRRTADTNHVDGANAAPNASARRFKERSQADPFGQPVLAANGHEPARSALLEFALTQPSGVRPVMCRCQRGPPFSRHVNPQRSSVERRRLSPVEPTESTSRCAGLASSAISVGASTHAPYIRGVEGWGLFDAFVPRSHGRLSPRCGSPHGRSSSY